MGGRGNGGLRNRSNTDYYHFEELSESRDVDDWFYGNSNFGRWRLDEVTDEEKKALKEYMQDTAQYMNASLYSGDSVRFKEEVDSIEHALNGFQLNTAMQVSRLSNFEIFGADKNGSMTVDQVKSYLKKEGTTKKIPAFLSFSAGGEVSYAHSSGSGLKINLNIPPSIGAGAYVGQFSRLRSENEFLVNRNSILRFDVNSVRKVGNNIVIDAYWERREKN